MSQTSKIVPCFFFAVILVGAVVATWLALRSRSEADVEKTTNKESLLSISTLMSGNITGTNATGVIAVVEYDFGNSTKKYVLAFSKFRTASCNELQARVKGTNSTTLVIELSDADVGGFSKQLSAAFDPTSYTSTDIVCGTTTIGSTTFAVATSSSSSSSPSSFERAAAPLVVKQASFTGNMDYTASGVMKIVRSNDLVAGEVVQRYSLFFENIKVSSGPDVVLYLSTKRNARNIDGSDTLIVPLDGRPAGTFSKEGDFSQSLPQDFDPAIYQSAVIWCRRYSVLFGFGSLQ